MKHLLPSIFSNRTINVAIAGAGGNGSQMLNGLARMNVALTALGHPGLDVCVFDPDIVTEANVGRQLFSPSDVGAFKAHVLVNRVNLYYNLQWNAVNTKYQAGHRWGEQSADILVGCVDSAAARRDLAKTRFKYWLDLGNTDKKGQVILGTRTKPKPIPKGVPLVKVLANENKSMAAKDYKVEYEPGYRPRLVTEIFPELNNKRVKEDDAPSCSLAQALQRQDLFINQAVATFGLQLLWQFIRQGGLDIHGYFINLETGNVRPLPIEPITNSLGAKPAKVTKPKAEPKSRTRKFRGKVKIGADLAATIASLKRSKRADMVKRIAKRKRSIKRRKK